MTQTLSVEGMSCAHCEESVEEAAENVDGVTDAAANRETEQVDVEGNADTEELVEAIEDAGYTARP